MSAEMQDNPSTVEPLPAEAISYSQSEPTTLHSGRDEVEAGIDDTSPLGMAQSEASSMQLPMLQALASSVETLQISFHHLQQSFDSKIKYDASKERMVDTLHSELQAHREGLHFKILRPLLVDLIQLYDDLSRILRDTQPPETMAQSEARLRQNVETCLITLEDMLASHGVDAYYEVGEDFVGGRQRAIGSQNTHDRQLDRKVAERVRKGFSFENKILRPEWVTTYKYEGIANAQAGVPVMPPTDTE